MTDTLQGFNIMSSTPLYDLDEGHGDKWAQTFKNFAPSKRVRPTLQWLRTYMLE